MLDVCLLRMEIQPRLHTNCSYDLIPMNFEQFQAVAYDVARAWPRPRSVSGDVSSAPYRTDAARWPDTYCYSGPVLGEMA